LDWTDAQRQKRAVAEYLAAIEADQANETEQSGGEALSLHKPHSHCRPHDALKNMAQHITLAEAAEPVGQKCRMVWDLVLEIELAEMG
jgi:hypothetical protein